MVRYTENVEGLIVEPPDIKLFEEYTGLSKDMVKGIMPLFESVRPSELETTLQKELKPLGGYGETLNTVIDNVKSNKPLFENVEADSISIFRLAYSLIGSLPSTGSEDGRRAIMAKSADVIGKIDTTPTILTAHADTTPISVYTSLKDLLARNNKRWGDNYHLSNAHDAIVEYLNTEIQSISTSNYVHSIDDSFYQQLIETILTDIVPPMWRSSAYLKTQISDIQTLIFDLSVIITSYIKGSRNLSSINQRRINSFAKAATNLYDLFVTSIPKSRVYAENNNEGEVYVPNRGYTNVMVNKMNGHTYYYMYMDSIPHDNILECMYMIQSCSNEVSIMFRKVISDYCTKAYQLLTDIKRIRYESSKFVDHGFNKNY
jgi:hypothetical protein